VELFGKIPTHLAMGIAAVMHYYYMDDSEAKLIQETIQQQDIHHAIETFTGLKTGTALFTAVEEGN
jgi:mannitol-1-phosphate/altronate dehydrogenase